ncbi:MAG: NAD-dependent dihydropyrimidine dehydrogenase subunit PreA [Clostridia bacterium]
MENKYIDLVVASEVSRCMICYDAKCSKACTKDKDPARAIQALRFKNKTTAASIINVDTCRDCKAPCEQACNHFDTPIRIKTIAESLQAKSIAKVDLSIDFCGVKCENPFFLSSSVVASGYEMCARALEMGWAGIVYKTIGFYKPEEVSPRFDATQDANRSFAGFKNLEQISEKSVEENFAILKKLKENYPTKIIVSSIMGQSDEEWTKLATLSEQAGCDIVECNFSCPHMSVDGVGSDVGQNPELVAQYTKAVRKGTTLPILAKMTPNISHMEIPARAAISAGADGLAAINTIKSISHINHKTLASAPDVDGKSSVSGYSGRSVKPIALRFIHDMAKCKELKDIPISGMGGIENYEDVLDFMMLGCANIQITTSVMEYGYRIVYDLIDGVSQYMSENGIDNLQDIVGSALENVAPADDLDRASIVYPKFNRQKCVMCKRCYISCLDAGHQAIAITESGGIMLNATACVGCHLCKLVCPVGAIENSKRFPKKN